MKTELGKIQNNIQSKIYGSNSLPNSVRVSVCCSEFFSLPSNVVYCILFGYSSNNSSSKNLQSNQAVNQLFNISDNLNQVKFQHYIFAHNTDYNYYIYNDRGVTSRENGIDGFKKSAGNDDLEKGDCRTAGKAGREYVSDLRYSLGFGKSSTRDVLRGRVSDTTFGTVSAEHLFSPEFGKNIWSTKKIGKWIGKTYSGTESEIGKSFVLQRNKNATDAISGIAGRQEVTLQIVKNHTIKKSLCQSSLDKNYSKGGALCVQ